MNEEFLIALAQISTTPGRTGENLDRHLAAVREATARGARLVVFPELSVTGYLLNHGVDAAAVTLDDHRLRPLLEASRDVAMVVGVPLREPGGWISNAALLLEDGRVCGAHRKMYLPTYGMFDEGRFFVPGRSLAPLTCSLGRFGVLICEDAWHLSTAVLLARQEVDAFLVVAGGPTELDGGDLPAGTRRWHWIVGATAVTAVTPCYFANRCGWEEGVQFGGGSWAVDGRGVTLAEPASACEETVLVAPFSRRQAARTRSLVPIPFAERWELWRRAGANDEDADA